MDLDVLAVGEHHEATHFLTVQDHFSISALQSKADSLGHHEGNRWQNKYAIRENHMI